MSISKYEMVELGKMVDIMAGYPFQSARFSDIAEDIPLVKGENVHQGYISWSSAKKWPANESDEFIKYLLIFNDIVIAMDRPWVEAGLKWSWIKKHDPESLLVQRIARLRAKESLNQFYLRYIIGSKYFENYIKPIVTGVNVPHISANQIAKCKIPLPPLPIQEKIAAVLSAYDDLIENNNRRIALLEKTAEEFYREWFVRMRFPGHEKATFHKRIPKDWEIKKLGGIINLVMGQSPKSEYYNTIGNGLPFNQGVGTYGPRFPKKEIFCSVDGRRAHKRDILISVRAPVGRLNIADSEMIIGRGLAALNHKKGYNSYLFYMLKYCFNDEDIIGNGAIFNSVGKNELRNFKILIPNDTTIKNYNDIAAKIDLMIEMRYKSLAILKQTRDLLLGRLISGKLSVENLDVQFPPSMEKNNA